MRIRITRQAPPAHDETSPPIAWNQRARRGLPFAPGRDGERFEIHFVDDFSGPVRRFDLNVSTGEVFERRPDGRFDAPTWFELPPEIRRAVHASVGPRASIRCAR